jgi:nitrate reductase delta subunit
MHLYQLFADLLDYPTGDLPPQARALWDRLSSLSRVAASADMARFCAFVEQTPLPRLEEIYTRTFDLQAVCYPYVGYHLFGESYKRGAFMAELNRGYRERGFSTGNELPDHVAVVLRFLALKADDEFGRTLLGEGLAPAVGKMAKAFREESDNPYAQVLDALLLVLTDRIERGMSDA